MENTFVVIFDPDKTVLDTTCNCLSHFSYNIIKANSETEFYSITSSKRPCCAIFNVDSPSNPNLTKLYNLKQNIDDLKLVITTNNVAVLGKIKDIPVLVKPYNCNSIKNLLNSKGDANGL